MDERDGNVRSPVEDQKTRFLSKAGFSFFSGSACFLTCPHFIVLDLGNWRDIRKSILSLDIVMYAAEPRLTKAAEVKGHVNRCQLIADDLALRPLDLGDIGFQNMRILPRISFALSIA